MVGLNGHRLDLTKKDLESTINGVMGYLPYDMLIPYFAKSLSKDDLDALVRIWNEEHGETK